MLYLEDFLELIEPLPMELREKSTELRVLDLQVQRGLDQVAQLTRELFSAGDQQQQPTMSQEDRDRKYARIKEEYKRIREQAEEKLALAEQMHTMLEKYHTRLSHDVTQFKYDLEADNQGVTVTIEKKLAEAEKAMLSARKEKRKRQMTGSGGGVGSVESGGGLLDMTGIFGGVDDLYMGRGGGGVSSLNDLLVSDPLQPPQKISSAQKRISLTTKHSAGPGMSSTTADRDRWISHSPSPLASSYKGGGMVTPPVSLSTAGSSSMLASQESRHGRPRKLTSRVQEMFKETVTHRHREPRPHQPTTSADSDASEEEASDEEDEFETEDAKRTWCFCNQKSYGEMVACDNKDCPYEWFHYHCVNITAPPKGKWFCPHCAGMNQRQRSKSVTSNSDD